MVFSAVLSVGPAQELVTARFFRWKEGSQESKLTPEKQQQPFDQVNFFPGGSVQPAVIIEQEEEYVHDDSGNCYFRRRRQKS